MIGAEPNGSGTRLSIIADDIQVVGDIFNALAGHLGLTEQSCVSEFPSQIALARQVLGDAKTGSFMATRMQADVADATTGIKTLVRSLFAAFESTTSCEVVKEHGHFKKHGVRAPEGRDSAGEGCG